MENLIHTKLLKFSNNKSLFRQELTDTIKTLNEEDVFELYIHCYKYYSNTHPDVLLDVFHSHFGLQEGNTAKESSSLKANIKD